MEKSSHSAVQYQCVHHTEQEIVKKIVDKDVKDFKGCDTPSQHSAKVEPSVGLRWANFRIISLTVGTSWTPISSFSADWACQLTNSTLQ